MTDEEEGAAQTQAPRDFIQPFLIDHSHIRGRFVRLGPVADTILHRHDYPAPASRLLAEMLVLASMLSSNLKTQGILTIQAKGEGPVQLAVVDATSYGTLRGYVQLAEGVESTLRKSKVKHPALSQLMGKGYLAITLDQGGENDRYQGIVDLSGNTLSEAVQSYFTQSQQVKMDVKVMVKTTGRGKKQKWSAGGIMLERLPEEGGTAPSHSRSQMEDEQGQDSEEQWNRIRLFMHTVTADELLQERYTPWNVLRRLFQEDGVWAYMPHALSVGCRCSPERILDILSTLPPEEVKSLLVDGRIEVTCQFCNKTEAIKESVIDRIFGAPR